MKPDVFIRADGSSTIGVGHLVRCSALAHMLKEDFQIIFFCREIPDKLISEFRSGGFKVRMINSEEDFLKLLLPNHIAVLDGYSFDLDYQRRVKATGCKLVCIDDLHNREFVADLIINHAPGISTNDYKAQPYTRFALGSDYALLRPAFLEQAKRERKIEKIETLLICFGGSDLMNLTQKTVRLALGLKKFKKIIVIIGVAYKYYESLSLLIENDPRISFRKNLSEAEMLEAMLEADQVVVPASGIIFEAIACKNIVVAGFYVENQASIYKGFVQLDAIIPADNFDSNKLSQAIGNETSSLVNSNKIIDGNSGKRISNRFAQLIK